MRNVRKNDGADPIRICLETSCSGAELCQLGGCQIRPPAGRRMARGERIWLPERGGMRFRVVRRGLVATCAMTLDGRRQILCLNAPGDVICPMSAEGSESWYEALAATELCELDLTPLAGQLHGDPAFAAMLFRLAHERLQGSAIHLFALGRFDAMERVCCFLADMARRIGVRQNSGWHVNLPMSREDIADYLGLNADTVGRILKRITREGLARFPVPTKCQIPCLERLESRIPILLGRSRKEPLREERERAPSRSSLAGASYC